MSRSMCNIAVMGLGVMGANLARNFAGRGHRVAIFNRTTEVARGLVERHPEAHFTLCEDAASVVASLERPRQIVLMVPAGPAVDSMLDLLDPLLEQDDVVIDAGNSLYSDTDARAKRAAGASWRFLGMGVSGGSDGALRGPSIMPGGDEEAWRQIRPALESAAAVTDSGPCVTYCGRGSAGHFVKMVHNGIEYALMAAYAEGLNILAHANTGTQSHAEDAETTPLRNPDDFRYDINLAEVAEVWRRGSVISSWLLDLTAEALCKSPQLKEFTGRVSDSGEGRWTSIAAIESGTPARVLTTALYDRFTSRGESDFADQLLSAMRFGFGGHHEKSDE